MKNINKITEKINYMIIKINNSFQSKTGKHAILIAAAFLVANIGKNMITRCFGEVWLYEEPIPKSLKKYQKKY